MEPPSFPTSGLPTLRAVPGGDAALVLPLPSGTPPFQFEWTRAGAKLNDRFKTSDDAGGVRLNISAAKTGDSGVYILQASNAAGKDTTRVQLEVSPDEMPTGEDPPTFLRRLQDLTVKVGTRTRFLVEIVSSSECRVTWYRNERRLLEAERIALVRDGNFWCADIAAVSVDDAGRWTCTAENIGGRASCSAHLNVLVPKAYKRPEFVEELRALLTEQGTVSLECKVVGVPTPVLRWFKDSREIKAGDVFALTANAEDPTSLGTYTCEAVNCMGRAYSSSKVHVVGRSSREGSTRPTSAVATPEPPPIFTKELEDQFVRICDPLILSCSIVVPPWPRSVVWYNKEGKIEASDRYRVLEDGVGGYLLEVQSAEWPDEGEWKCVATSSGGRVGISTCYVSMDVPKNYRKPRFMENLQAVLTEEGLVSFECKVVGFPTPVLSWFKDGQELKPGDVYQLTGTNSLGSYCCIARNCMGQASSSAELTVEDIQNQLNEEEKLQLFSKNQAPKFLQGLKSVEAKIDESFRFTVKVAIPPEPTVSWYRDDQPVDESSRCHLVQEERGLFSLDILHLEFMDQAEWKCVAMNDYGQSVTSCFLKLIIPRHYKKPRFLENLQAILSDEGAVNLECKVIGVPQPVLKWYKDGEELKPGDIHKIISGQDGTCCLGTYTCEAQNCMGIAASSASLLGFEDSMKVKNKKKTDEQVLQRNLSLSTIHEERTSQMYDTPVGDITLDERGEISFSFDGKEVSVSLYETPDLTEEEALQIVEMYADQLSENVTEHNVVELPPLRFVKETSTSGNLLMEAIIIDVSPEYFTSPEEDLRTEADIEDISIADENGAPQLSLDQESINGEDYLEKTVAVLSEEKADFPKKTDRKKSDSQKSVDDYFSLSRDQSISDEKKDDDTQALSESELQSYASARSSGKPKSKSSKPSLDDGGESSEITKTVLLREDLQKQTGESDNKIHKISQKRRTSRGSRRSSPGSDKSVNKTYENLATENQDSNDISKTNNTTEENVKAQITDVSSSLTKVINDIQIIERDIILKSELMSTAATASQSLEIINSLLTPLTEIHSITDAIQEISDSSEIVIPLLNRLPQSLETLQQSLTIISKCIDYESDKKTLVMKTSTSIIEKCGNELQNSIKGIISLHNIINQLTKVKALSVEKVTTDIIRTINDAANIVNVYKNRNIEIDTNISKESIESKHLNDTQKVAHELRSSLKSILHILDEVDMSTNKYFKISNTKIILNDMSIPIQDLQNALEHIETLSIAESKYNLPKYNTDVIETVMNSVLKLRTSFEQLSADVDKNDNKDDLNEIINAIKSDINEISLHLISLEAKTGTYDILNSDNKLEVLQKMAHILITLENNIPLLESTPGVKTHLSDFHKNMTKILENVIESNEAAKYIHFLEICDSINRINTSLKNIEVNNILSLASISNTLKIIQQNVIQNIFEEELNLSVTSIINNVLSDIQKSINNVEEETLNLELESAQVLTTKKYDEKKVNIVVEQIKQAIASLSSVTLHETVTDLSLVTSLNKICPILEDIRYNISNVVQEAENDENVSDIDSFSYTESIAHQICDLHQTVNVLKQVLYESVQTQENYKILNEYVKPLLELSNTLQILQHDVISQYKDNIESAEISSSIANIVESLRSCVVVIQEQPIIEAVDDMSTLEDISGLKSIAEILPCDALDIVAVKERTCAEGDVHFAPTLQSASGKVLQTLSNDITTLLQPQTVEIVDFLTNSYNLSDLKLIITQLETINSSIQVVLQHIEDFENIPIFNLQIAEIAQSIQMIYEKLSSLQINNIKIIGHIKQTDKEKIIFLTENISQLKNKLSESLCTLQPALEVADSVINESNKIIKLRKICKQMNILLQKKSSSIPEHREINTLKEAVIDFIEATNNLQEIKISRIKRKIENIHTTAAVDQDKLIKFTAQQSDSLQDEALIISCIDDLTDVLASLQESPYLNIFNDLEIPYSTTSFSVSDVKINALRQVHADIKNILIGLESISRETLNDNMLLVEDFCKTFENEITLLRHLVQKPMSPKRVIKLLQVFYKLCSNFKEFKYGQREVPLDLNSFFVNTDECLKHLQLLLTEIIETHSHLLFDIPLSNINSVESRIRSLIEITKTNDQLLFLKQFLSLIESLQPHIENLHSSLIQELYLCLTKKPDLGKKEIEFLKKFELFTSFLSHQLRNVSENDSFKDIYGQISNVIKDHEDYEDAIGSGQMLIVIKCMSECSQILQQNLNQEPMIVPSTDNSFSKQLFKIKIPLEKIYTNILNIQREYTSTSDSKKALVPFEVNLNNFSDLEEISKELEKYQNFENLSVTHNDVALIKEFLNKMHICEETLTSTRNVSDSQSIKSICKPIENIKLVLYKVLLSQNVISEESGISNGTIKALLQHMAEYIEVIEVVEELSTVIKLEDLKESADIVRELQQNIASENIDSSIEVSVESINKKQLQLAQKLQKALISLQSEVFESQQECIPSISEDVRRQIIEVVTDLQNDLLILTRLNILEQDSTMNDIKEPYHNENIMTQSKENNLTPEVQNLELIKSTSENLQESLVDKSTIVTLQDSSKEKLVNINDTLFKQLEEYLCMKTVDVVEKISLLIPNSKMLTESIQIARQLKELSVLQGLESVEFSKPQLGLALKLEKALSSICEIVNTENEELKDLTLNDELQKTTNVISDLKNTLHALITCTLSQVGEQVLDLGEVKVTIINQAPVSYECTINESSSALSTKAASASVIDVHETNSDIAIPENQNTDDLRNDETTIDVLKNEIDTVTRNITTDETNNKTDNDNQLRDEPTNLSQNTLLRRLDEYICMQTVDVIEKLTPLVPNSETLKESIQVARQLQELSTLEGLESIEFSKPQLGLALKLEKALSSTCEIVNTENEELKDLTLNDELQKTTYVISDLKDTLHSLITCTLSQVEEQVLDLGEVKVTIINQAPVSYECTVNETTSALSVTAASASVIDVHETNSDIAVPENQNTDDLRNDETTIDVLKNEINTLTHITMDETNNKTDNDNQLRDEPTNLSQNTLLRRLDEYICMQTVDVIEKLTPLVPNSETLKESIQVARQLQELSALEGPESIEFSKPQLGLALKLEKALSSTCEIVNTENEELKDLTLNDELQKTTNVISDLKDTLHALITCTLSQVGEQVLDLGEVKVTIINQAPVSYECTINESSSALSTKAASASVIDVHETNSDIAVPENQNTDDLRNDETTIDVLKNEINTLTHITMDETNNKTDNDNQLRDEPTNLSQNTLLRRLDEYICMQTVDVIEKLTPLVPNSETLKESIQVARQLQELSTLEGLESIEFSKPQLGLALKLEKALSSTCEIVNTENEELKDLTLNDELQKTTYVISDLKDTLHSLITCTLSQVEEQVLDLGEVKVTIINQAPVSYECTINETTSALSATAASASVIDVHETNSDIAVPENQNTDDLRNDETTIDVLKNEINTLTHITMDETNNKTDNDNQLRDEPTNLSQNTLLRRLDEYICMQTVDVIEKLTPLVPNSETLKESIQVARQLQELSALEGPESIEFSKPQLGLALKLEKALSSTCEIVNTENEELKDLTLNDELQKTTNVISDLKDTLHALITCTLSQVGEQVLDLGEVKVTIINQAPVSYECTINESSSALSTKAASASVIDVHETNSDIAIPENQNTDDLRNDETTIDVLKNEIDTVTRNITTDETNNKTDNDNQLRDEPTNLSQNTLLRRLDEYICMQTVDVIEKLTPLVPNSETLKESIQVARQLQELSAMEGPESIEFSKPQLGLALKLEKALSSMCEIVNTENEELKDLTLNDELQKTTNVISDLKDTLHALITCTLSQVGEQVLDLGEVKVTIINQAPVSYECTINETTSALSATAASASVIDVHETNSDIAVPENQNTDDLRNDETTIDVLKNEINTLTHITMDETNNKTDNDNQLRDEPTNLSQNTLLRRLDEYICMQTVDVIEKLTPLVPNSETLKESIQVARQLQELSAMEGPESIEFSKPQLGLALKLEKALSSMCEIVYTENEELKDLTLNDELQKTTNVTSDLKDTLHALITCTLSQVGEQVLDLGEVKVTIINQAPVSYECTINETTSALSATAASASVIDVHETNSDIAVPENQNTDDLRNDETTIDVLKNEINTLTHITMDETNNKTDNDNQLRDEPTNLSQNTLLRRLDEYICMQTVDVIEKLTPLVPNSETLKESIQVARQLQELSALEGPESIEFSKPQLGLALKLEKALSSTCEIVNTENEKLKDLTLNDELQKTTNVISDLKDTLHALITCTLSQVGEQVLDLGEVKVTIINQAPVSYECTINESSSALSTKAASASVNDVHETNSDIAIPENQNTDDLRNDETTIDVLKNEIDTVTRNITTDETNNKTDNANQLRDEPTNLSQNTLLRRLDEYICMQTVDVIEKLTPLVPNSETLKESIQVARQLQELSALEGPESIEFSKPQLGLALKLEKALSSTCEIVNTENEELKDLTLNDELQKTTNVISDLKDTLHALITCTLSQVGEQVLDLGEVKVTIINQAPVSYECTINESSSALSTKAASASVIDVHETNSDIAIPENQNTDDLRNDETTIDVLKNEIDTVTRNITTDETNNKTDNDNQLRDEPTNLSQNTLLRRLDEYICMQTVDVIEKLTPLVPNSETLKESIQVARQLQELSAMEGPESIEFSKPQLGLALKLEKALSSMCEIVNTENEELKDLTLNDELQKTTNVISDLKDTLHALITCTLSQVGEQVLDLGEVKVTIINQAPVSYECTINETTSALSATAASASVIDVHETNSDIAVPENQNTDDLRNDETTIDVLKNEINTLTHITMDETNNKTDNDNQLRDEPTNLSQNVERGTHSLQKIENLLEEAIDIIDMSVDTLTINSYDILQNTLDEIQTIVMKLKYECAFTIRDTFNDTLEDFECNVRSVQLQVNEHCPTMLLKEACVNLQMLVLSLNEVRSIENTNIMPNTISNCSDDAKKSIDLLEKAFCIVHETNYESIILKLQDIKDTLKSLRSNCMTDAEALIIGGIDVIQSLDQIEERIFLLEKDIDTEITMDLITRDSILTAVHSVYGSISNMRGMISSIQKKYMYDNYGKPSGYILQSLKNINEISKIDNNRLWKVLAKCLRKVLNHFEDIKFYINFDKTARLPSDAAFTKIIFSELYTVISGIKQEYKNLDGSEHGRNCSNYINKILNDIENKETLEVRDKIPVFINISNTILEFTQFVNNIIAESIGKNKLEKNINANVSSAVLEFLTSVASDEATDISKEKSKEEVSKIPNFDKIELLEDNKTEKTIIQDKNQDSKMLIFESRSDLVENNNQLKSILIDSPIPQDIELIEKKIGAEEKKVSISELKPSEMKESENKGNKKSILAKEYNLDTKEQCFKTTDSEILEQDIISDQINLQKNITFDENIQNVNKTEISKNGNKLELFGTEDETSHYGGENVKDVEITKAKKTDKLLLVECGTDQKLERQSLKDEHWEDDKFSKEPRTSSHIHQDTVIEQKQKPINDDNYSILPELKNTQSLEDENFNILCTKTDSEKEEFSKNTEKNMSVMKETAVIELRQDHTKNELFIMNNDGNADINIENVVKTVENVETPLLTTNEQKNKKDEKEILKENCDTFISDLNTDQILKENNLITNYNNSNALGNNLPNQSEVNYIKENLIEESRESKQKIKTEKHVKELEIDSEVNSLEDEHQTTMRITKEESETAVAGPPIYKKVDGEYNLSLTNLNENFKKENKIDVKNTAEIEPATQTVESVFNYSTEINKSSDETELVKEENDHVAYMHDTIVNEDILQHMNIEHTVPDQITLKNFQTDSQRLELTTATHSTVIDKNKSLKAAPNTSQVNDIVKENLHFTEEEYNIDKLKNIEEKQEVTSELEVNNSLKEAQGENISEENNTIQENMQGITVNENLVTNILSGKESTNLEIENNNGNTVEPDDKQETECQSRTIQIEDNSVHENSQDLKLKNETNKTKKLEKRDRLSLKTKKKKSMAEEKSVSSQEVTTINKKGQEMKVKEGADERSENAQSTSNHERNHRIKEEQEVADQKVIVDEVNYEKDKTKDNIQERETILNTTDNMMAIKKIDISNQEKNIRESIIFHIEADLNVKNISAIEKADKLIEIKTSGEEISPVQAHTMEEIQLSDGSLLSPTDEQNHEVSVSISESLIDLTLKTESILEGTPIILKEEEPEHNKQNNMKDDYKTKSEELSAEDNMLQNDVSQIKKQQYIINNAETFNEKTKEISEIASNEEINRYNINDELLKKQAKDKKIDGDTEEKKDEQEPKKIKETKDEIQENINNQQKQRKFRLKTENNLDHPNSQEKELEQETMEHNIQKKNDNNINKTQLNKGKKKIYGCNKKEKNIVKHEYEDQKEPKGELTVVKQDNENIGNIQSKERRDVIEASSNQSTFNINNLDIGRDDTDGEGILKSSDKTTKTMDVMERVKTNSESNSIFGQIAIDEKSLCRPELIDHTKTDYALEFSKPPGYIPRSFDLPDTVPQIKTNSQYPTIYKAQTLLYDSQLRSSMSPHIDQQLNDEYSQVKETKKTASESRSISSDKRAGISRDAKRKPVFSTHLTDRTAVESSRVKLTCSILSPSNPNITWYKNGVLLDNKQKFRSKTVEGLITLEVLNAVPSDSGEYSCTVENENGSITSSANLKVYPSFEASPIPPTFTRPIRDIYHLAENELVLECRIRGQPLPNITWYKNDKHIILNDRFQAHYLADGVCRLTISSPTSEDSGKYTCRAENSVWSDQISHEVLFSGKTNRVNTNIIPLQKINLRQQVLESRRPHFTNVLSDHKVVSGGTIGLQVEIRGSPTRVEWLREGHSVTDLYRNAQTYVDHEIYTLALTDVTEQESGLYTCRAWSTSGNVDMNAAITVVQPNLIDGKPATIVSRPPKDLLISVGEDLNISFRVHGDPKPKVFFMKGMRDITNSQRACKMSSDDYVKFTLKRSVVSDAGTYCIFARNAYGCDRAFVTVVIRQRASSDSLISDWTYPMDDLAISSIERNYKSVPDRIPSEPSVVDGGQNWISLAWPKPDPQARAPILAYKVEGWRIGKEGGARWVELGITPRNSFDAFNLQQGEEYHFRITPRNRYGWGESVQTSMPIGIGLSGDRPEFIEILPGQLKVLVGETALLGCTFKGKPVPEIIWMKNGHEVEEEAGRIKITIDNLTTFLKIDNVNIEDEGRYSCEASNVLGRSSTYARMTVITDRHIWEADAKLKKERSAGIDGEYPPQFTMRLRDRRVQATYPVRLTCQVVGNPRPILTWFKNGEQILIDDRHAVSQDEHFYTLEIAPTTLEDGGVYEAMARNSYGAVSCRCSLVVDKGIRAYIAPEFCCGLQPLYRLSEGDELRISAVVEAYPSVGVTWYRDGVRLRPSRKAIMTLDRDGQIELALASVTGRDAGIYTCTASNEVGRASTSGKVEVVSGENVVERTTMPPIVISPDVPYSKEPIFIKKPRSSEAREGDTVIIECEVVGDPKPDVYWLRDFLKPDYYRDASHFKRVGAGPAYRFEIPHAKLDYTGAYSIIAKNMHGEAKAIISLQILAKDPRSGDDVHNIRYGRVDVIPRFDKDLTDLLCYDGDAVEFECRVSGNPEPDIRWFHYNEIVPECLDFESSYDLGTARLKIKQVTAEDEGTYRCEASNTLGKATSSACLVVYPPGEPNTLSQRLRRPPALLSAASTPRSTPRSTPARSMSRTPGPDSRRLCSPSREIAPKFYTYPYNKVAEEGDTVVFQCAVKGLPPPWATWDKDGIIITPSARFSIREKDEMFKILEIEQVTIDDVGLYRITLENDYGRAEASARLEVISQKGKFYGSTRSYSVSPRKSLPYRRRTPSFSKQD